MMGRANASVPTEVEIHAANTALLLLAMGQPDAALQVLAPL
jgi:hypothetical protein